MITRTEAAVQRVPFLGSTMFEILKEPLIWIQTISFRQAKKVLLDSAPSRSSIQDRLLDRLLE